MVLPSAVSFTIPFPRPKERGRQRGPSWPKPQLESGRRKQAAAARRDAPPSAPKPPPKPWDFTITDQSQHRLSEAEMAFRRSLRQSRHRHRAAAATERPPQQSQDAEAQWEAEGALALEGEIMADVIDFEVAEQHPRRGYTSDSGQVGSASEGEASDGPSEAASLSGMQAFVAQLQEKYGLSGVLPAPAGAAAPTSRAQRKLAELRAAAATAAAAEGSASGSDSDDDGLEEQLRALHEAGASRRHRSMPAPPAAAAAPALEGDSDSEGGGHLGPAAARRARRRQAPAAPEAAAAHGLQAYQLHAQQVQQQQQQALLDRLASAEARLGQLAGVEAQLAATQATVAELQEQNGQLRTELDDFVSHTSTLLTSLQSQLSGFLTASAAASTSQAAGSAAGPTQQHSPLLHLPVIASRTSDASAAVVQVRAAAEALAIAQAGAATSARSAAPGTAAAGNASSVNAPEEMAMQAAAQDGDVLARLQLPTFRRFAELRQAGNRPRPQPSMATAACTAAPLASSAATVCCTSAAAAAWQQHFPLQTDNDPAQPQPRTLPQGLLQRTGGAVGAAPAAGGFEWRPLSAADP